MASLFLCALVVQVLAASFEYCGKQQVINVLDFRIETNQWNNKDNLLKQCVRVDQNDKAKTVGWQIEWQQTTPSELPKSYPNLEAIKGVPVRLKDIVFLNASFAWDYSTTTGGNTEADLTAAGLRSNVAIDMFFDQSADRSTSTAEARLEIMIWTAKLSDTAPLGYWNTWPVVRIELYGVDWWVYRAPNQLKQKVITFIRVGGEPVMNIDWDIMVFLRQVYRFEEKFVPDLWLGHFQVGSECFVAKERVRLTFTNMDIKIGARADADLPSESGDKPIDKPTKSLKLPPPADSLRPFAPPDMAGIPVQYTAVSQNITVVADYGILVPEPDSLHPPADLLAGPIVINGHKAGSDGSSSGALPVAMLNVGVLLFSMVSVGASFVFFSA